MPRHITLIALAAVALAAVALGAVKTAHADPNLPPGRTGDNGSNQAAGPSGQHPGQVGEIGGAGPHPGPQSRPSQTGTENERRTPAPDR